MKRLLLLLFSTLLLSATLCISASASDFDAVAEDLSTIGMFRGTAHGFELDRAPTRSEAAIMLVRLYGAEEAAKSAYESGEISHPFTDVSAFTSPYVAWLYTNGITNGFTETTYASQRACSAQNYVVFLLRALGYKDGVDFQYADALSFAQKKGFYDPALFTGEFLRDDLAALTYQGLATDMADEETYLLDALIGSGAIEKTSAKPMTEKIEAYRTINSALTALDAGSIDADILQNIDMDIAAEINGSQIQFSAASSTLQSIQIVSRDNQLLQLGYVQEISENGEHQTTSIWLKDNYLYTVLEKADMGLYSKTPLTETDTLLQELDTIDAASMDVSGLAVIDTITEKRVGSDIVYTVLLSENMGGMLDTLIADIGEDFTSTTIDAVSLVYTLDYNGQLKSEEISFHMSATANMPMDDGAIVPAAVSCTYHMAMTVNATGPRVKVSYPDFSKLIEIAPFNAM